MNVTVRVPYSRRSPRPSKHVAFNDYYYDDGRDKFGGFKISKYLQDRQDRDFRISHDRRERQDRQDHRVSNFDRQDRRHRDRHRQDDRRKEPRIYQYPLPRLDAKYIVLENPTPELIHIAKKHNFLPIIKGERKSARRPHSGWFRW